MNLLKKRRIAIGGLFFLSGLCFSSWASRIPDFQALFRLSEGQLGTLLLGMPAGALIALPIAAWLVHQYGSRIVILLGISTYLLFLTALGASASGFQLGIMVIVFGILGNIMNISLNTQAIAVEKAYGRNILNSFHGLWSLAGFFGAGIGALMVFLQISPFYHYLIVFCIGLIIILAAQGFIKKEAKSLSGAGFVFQKPDGLILRIGLVGFCGMMCEGCMFDWSGVYMAKVVIPEKQLVPLGYVGFMGSMALARFFADGLANRWGKIFLLQMSGILIFSGLSMAVLFPTFITTVLGFIVVGLGTASVVPLSYSIAGRSPLYSPEIALAMVSTISFFGFLLGPPLIGFVAELLNLQVSFTLIAIMGVCIAILVSVKQKVFKIAVNEQKL